MGNDIWASDRDSLTSPWQEPRNLGEAVNSAAADFCPTLLMAELERIRVAGYAIIDQELEIGSKAIAVPIRNMSGRTIAAFNVAAHAARATSERLLNELLPHLLDAQAQLAEILP